MIKATNISVEMDSYARVMLVADTQAEIDLAGTSGETIIGLPKGTVLSMGSIAITADGKFGMLKSTGTWGWN